MVHTRKRAQEKRLAQWNWGQMPNSLQQFNFNVTNKIVGCIVCVTIFQLLTFLLYKTQYCWIYQLRSSMHWNALSSAITLSENKYANRFIFISSIHNQHFANTSPNNGWVWRVQCKRTASKIKQAKMARVFIQLDEWHNECFYHISMAAIRSELLIFRTKYDAVDLKRVCLATRYSLNWFELAVYGTLVDFVEFVWKFDEIFSVTETKLTYSWVHALRSLQLAFQLQSIYSRFM